jgi:uncharacterized protein (PEP-CTERM system associated)
MNKNRYAHSRPTITALLALAPCWAGAQEGGGVTRNWALEPSVSLRQTFTDNQSLQTVKESDSITEATAAVRISANSGRIRGILDYSLTGLLYARNNDANAVRHFLSSNATAELIEGQGFVDLRGSYSRQAISAFGSQTPTPSLSESNQTDVGSLGVSPYIRGRLAGFARYEARLSYDISRAKGTSAGDSESGAALLHIDGGGSVSPLGWSADVSHNISNYRAGRRTFDSRARAGVTYVVTNELRLGVTAGTERTDLRTLDAESNATYGAQLEWTPTERTLLSGNIEKRYFGTAHSLRFTHRTPNTSWAVTDSRDISNTSAQGIAGFGSAYDLFFRQFASAEPDAVKRDALVRGFLQTNGINPSAVVVGGFLAAAATLDRAQAASFALVGARNTVTLQVTARRSERADKISTAVQDDLSSSQQVRQRGLSLDWALRLTPQSSVNLGGSYQRSTGDSSTQQSTLKAITATWTSTLGPKTTVSAGARRAEFDSTTVPYDETAIFAALRYAF